MVGNASVSYVWRRVRATTFGIAVSMILIQVGNAQDFGPGPTPGITTLSGTNAAQQTMAQSINAFCPTVSNIAATPNQVDLKTICSAMIGNALQLQGGSSSGLGSYGLGESGLRSGLQSLNGGSELLIPTSQASVAQTAQTSRQTGTIEERLKELREEQLKELRDITGVTVAGIGPPRARQIASLSGLEPGDQARIRRMRR